MATEKSKTYFLDVFLHLLPIPLIFYFFAFHDSFRRQAMTFLGRSVLVLYILLFSYISIWLGTLYCIGLILYLQAIHSTPSNQTSAEKTTLLQQWSEMINPVRPTTSPYVPTTPHASKQRPQIQPVSYEAKQSQPRRSQGDRPNQGQRTKSPRKNQGQRTKSPRINHSQGNRPNQGQRTKSPRKNQGQGTRVPKQNPK